MILLLDIGNTHLHIGLGGAQRVVRQADVSLEPLQPSRLKAALKKLVRSSRVQGVCLCSVAPKFTPHVRGLVRQLWPVPFLELNHRSVSGIGIHYPTPQTIGADRLANAVAARHHYGAPVVVVDFGTAVTFDIVDRQGDYIGGIIAPGLSAMTSYLHEKTALLPSIRIRETRAFVGKSTEEAMLIGAVYGYPGLVKELLKRLRTTLQCPNLPVVATGGYARLMARHVSDIKDVNPLITLEGLRLVWRQHHPQ